MCGITGFWDLTGARVEPLAFDRFTDSLAHRGPDGRGVESFLDGALRLGHRRLAILDPSEQGKQPMSYEPTSDGPVRNGKARYWIVHNGEVFNFIEIRRELEALGHRFASQTDTEVIVAAYAEWGPDCQLRFNGMWAFAIWDNQERTLFLSRDRFGIKPLFFRRTKSTFIFASELKSFAFLGGPVAVDEIELARSIADTFYQDSRTKTLLNGVERLLPGHCAWLSAGSLRQRRWWTTLDHCGEVPASYAAQIEQFRELLTDACRLRMRSDEEVVSCLSGGLDSSAIVSLVARDLADWGRDSSARISNTGQTAITLSFPGAPNDETAFAGQVAEYAGVDWKTRYLADHYDVDDLMDAVWDSEAVYANAPLAILGTYRSVAELGYRVTLDGHGADEMLGGYGQHIVAAMKLARGFAHPLRTLELSGIYQGVMGGGAQWIEHNPWWMAVGFTPLLGQVLNAARAVKRQIRGDARNVTRWLRPHDADGGADRGLAELDDLDPFKRELYRSFHATVLPTYLRMFDRLAMASSVEIRMPFMDWRLVTFCFSLPATSLAGGGFSKRILRDCVKGAMPEAVRTRKDKIGIASPMANLFNGPLREPVREIVNEPGFLASVMWDGPAIRDHVNSVASWRYHEAQDVWRFINAYLLCEAFARQATR